MGTENKPLLSIKNLKTIFDLDEGSVKAIDGVSFDIFPQRVLGIVGESGCGKSVTIKSILRLIETPGRIVEGEILFQTRNQNKPQHTTEAPGENPGSGVTRLSGIYLGALMTNAVSYTHLTLPTKRIV